jgi:DNA-binding beta-propeller fold protein YncE
LFAGGPDGVTTIRTGDLTVTRRDLAGTAVDGLGITPDGTTLFALTAGDGRIVAIDTATGRTLGPVPGSGFDRLLAVAPW